MALQPRQLLLLYVVVFMYAACFMAQVRVGLKVISSVCGGGRGAHRRSGRQARIMLT
jgi:hypothetical protein